MATFDRLADLPLEVDRYELEGLRAEVSSGFERLSTVVRLHGGGHDGVGEDVVYDGVDHEALQQAGPVQALAGRYALGDFCSLIDSLDLFPVQPSREVSRLYRRWTFHSAALDLALRQAGRSLHEVLGREPRPVTFVVSLRLGEPPTLDPITQRLERYPTLRFKLDPTSSWEPDLIAALVDTGAVDSVDFKSLYRGTIVDQAPDAVLYRRVVDSFPHAWLEDPDVFDPDTAAVLEDHHDRITWDAPIHSIADIEALLFPPKMVNIKPSRIGGLRQLCAAYDYCAEHGIGAYGGGQFELGPGRGQAQYLASMFHPDTPNDLAPSGYNVNVPAPGLPSSPLPPAPDATGFRWGVKHEPPLRESRKPGSAKGKIVIHDNFDDPL
jgi:L-alanine-DL-glutamate epimerase-like enolase superfamily enzyme